MATPKQKPKTNTEAPAEVTESPQHETVTLSATFANHGSIVTRSGIVEFTNGTALVSSDLATTLRNQGFIV